jgi:hypothetical protein
MFFWLNRVTDAVQETESRKYFPRGPHFGQPWRRPQSLSDLNNEDFLLFSVSNRLFFWSFPIKFYKNFPLALFVHHVETEDDIVVITGCYFTAWAFSGA